MLVLAHEGSKMPKPLLKGGIVGAPIKAQYFKPHSSISRQLLAR